jgi:predicted NAD/FAD-binding protein
MKSSKSSQTTALRVGIVGGGAAGVFTAWALQQVPNATITVDLWEAQGRFGGNTWSIPYTYNDVTYNLDAGAQFFFANPQPTYISLLKSLGLFEQDVSSYPAGICLWDTDQNARTLFVPSKIENFFDGTLKLSDIPSLLQFFAFLLQAEALDKSGNWSTSISQWLPNVQWVTQDFKDKVLTPFLYQFVSLPLSRIGESSALYALTYFVRNVTGWPGQPVVAPDAGDVFTLYQSASIGLDGILAQIRSVTPNTNFQVNAAVASVGYDPVQKQPGLTVNSTYLPYDVVILTCDPQTAANLINVGGRAAQPNAPALLQAIEYAQLPITLQAPQSSYMPADPASWQAANTVVSNNTGNVAFSGYFGALRPPAGSSLVPAFKSWSNPPIASPPPDNLLFHSHSVLYPTTASIQARDALQALQGASNVYFAGGWNTWFDSQEAALRSALNVVNAMANPFNLEPGPVIEPWLAEPGGRRETTMSRFVEQLIARMPEHLARPLRDGLRPALARL